MAIKVNHWIKVKGVDKIERGRVTATRKYFGQTVYVVRTTDGVFHEVSDLRNEITRVK